jgi:small subunit ribosomal protein S8
MDNISNMIIQLKNAGDVGLPEVIIPHSKTKKAIAEVLKKEGFIKDFSEKPDKGKKKLVIELILDKRIPKIKGVSRISKPSRRIYRKSSEIRPIKNGYGALIVSTSAGIMSGYDAKRAGLGGEALFSIW